ncbi:hypothetical protein C8D79_1077 [Bacteriovorax stolpii]|nr:hypothetical protein C8D79_1077 [Bacteriovorax stolpii]
MGVMLHLEILSSSDPLAVGLYEFEFNRVHIGRSKKNDLIFLDSELPLQYMTIQIIQDKHGPGLVVKSLTRSPFFFVNGKKISGALKIRPNDVIAFGENKIKIHAFAPTTDETDLSEAFKGFAANASELRFALDFIEEVLIEVEEKTQNV